MALSGERAVSIAAPLARSVMRTGKQLAGRDFICGQSSIADFAAWLWVAPWKSQGIILDDFSNLKAGFQRVRACESVETGFDLGAELGSAGLEVAGKSAEEARNVLFGPRAC